MLFRSSYQKGYGLTLIRQIDSLNKIKIDSLINIKNYPDISKVGQEANEKFETILLHLSIENWSWYELIALNAIKKGLFKPVTHATIIDRYNVFKENKKQKYGFFNSSSDIENKKISDLDDAKNVDVLRCQLGLIPLKYYAKSRRLECPKDYNYEECTCY